ncbi:MAG: GAF domain-containing protein [Planctomycetia bacterium]|nr:GAF domain-containing protein [Planctomycetia bacterium]
MSVDKLMDVARHMVRAGPGQDMYRTLVTRSRRALGRGHGTSFFLVYRASDLVLPVAESSESGKRLHPQAYTQKITAGIIGHVVKSGKTYYAPDVAADPLFVSGGQTAGSELCVPVKFDGEVVGIFNIECARKHGFPPDLVARVELLCDAAAVLMNTGVAQEQQQAMEAQIRGLEEGLSHARARFEGLAGLVGDLVVVLDSAGKVSWQNGGMKGVLASAAGKEFASLLAPESADAWKSAVSRPGGARLFLRTGRTQTSVAARVLPLTAPDGPAGTLLLLSPAPETAKPARGKRGAKASKKKRR